MVTQNRASRIAKGIQEMLSEILLFEATDPRLQGVFVTDVTVDRELTQASVFVSALEGIDRKRDVLNGLEHARGFLRSALAQRSDLRVFPNLHFVWDKTPENAEHMEKLMATLREQARDEGKPSG